MRPATDSNFAGKIALLLIELDKIGSTAMAKIPLDYAPRAGRPRLSDILGWIIAGFVVFMLAFLIAVAIYER